MCSGGSEWRDSCNAESHQFEFNNVSVDREDSTITSGGSDNSDSEEQIYKIVNHYPKLIRESRYGIDGSFKRELINDSLVVTESTDIQQKQQADGKWYRYETSYEYVLGKLRPVARTKAMLLEGTPTEAQRASQLFLDEDRYRRAALLIEREDIEYLTKHDGSIIAESTFRVVENNAWKLEKRERQVVK